jgi:glycerate kinase
MAHTNKNPNFFINLSIFKDYSKPHKSKKMALQNQNIRKILIAPDKFKGSLTSSQASQAIRRGLEKLALEGNAPVGICSLAGEGGAFGNGGLQFRMVEIADGGDGSLEVVGKKVANGRIVQCEAADPVGVRRPVEYLMYEQGGKVCAFIEMAKVCGLAQLDPALRNPLKTSTYGLGEVILDAAGRGAVSITLSIGGSATDDCGAGMLQALGYQFTGAAGELLPVPVCGGDLERVVGIKEPKEKQWGNVEVICDVTNPLLGPNGATAVYAPQKGADSDALIKLEAGKRSFTGVAERCLGVAAESKEQPGAGAAGGVGFAFVAFMNAKLSLGIDVLLSGYHFDELVEKYDLVITGEGRLDEQSLNGKVISGIMNYHPKKLEFVVGQSKLDNIEYPVHAIVPEVATIDEALSNPKECLKRLIKKSFLIIKNTLTILKLLRYFNF